MGNVCCCKNKEDPNININIKDICNDNKCSCLSKCCISNQKKHKHHKHNHHNNLTKDTEIILYG